MFPLPDLSHLIPSTYNHVYEPAEDTFLLLDALEQDAELLSSTQPNVCLEIGSGSGCVSAFVAKLLGPRCLYLCTDINSFASDCTLRTGKTNKVLLHSVQASFAQPFRERLKGKIDIILFNPPYVPTDEDELRLAQEKRDIECSWSGGLLGMQVTNEFLRVVAEYLSPNGLFYLVVLKANDVQGIQRRMWADYSLHSEVCLERRAGREYLYILRFRKTGFK